MPKGCVWNISCNALYERKIRKKLYMWWIILLGSLVTLIMLVANSQKKPGSDLKNKFASLGNMKGMKYQELWFDVGI